MDEHTRSVLDEYSVSAHVISRRLLIEKPNYMYMHELVEDLITLTNNVSKVRNKMREEQFNQEL